MPHKCDVEATLVKQISQVGAARVGLVDRWAISSHCGSAVTDEWAEVGAQAQPGRWRPSEFMCSDEEVGGGVDHLPGSRKSRRPASVRATPREFWSKRRTPIWRSSRWMPCDSGGWVIPRSCAVWPK